ncbi:transcription antitermination factor NusB [Phragmitibacter flavus]|uniref:Transcription antitermination protein NusB n=1 Tax=Phragmitibacter flavus TaxID=2576071 RepID=A0A5R8KFG8_9BACT|nr:transcription antitermination factor NusB [Phragmitibacter flavus]TLD71050.1 transcription antitermination factor NusB [Phragmitibacter flavus]
MGKRREGRQAAIQYLFAHDLHGEEEVSEQERSGFWELHSANAKVREHAEGLLQGVFAHQAEIDQRISERLENYSFERVGTVDRNILRVAVYELLYVKEIPVRVVINEAVEIARGLGDTQTRIFVNGILDKIAKVVRPQAEREAAPEPEVEEHPTTTAD